MLTNLAFWRANARNGRAVERANAPRRRAAEPEPAVRDERLRAVVFSRADLYLALMLGIR